MEISFDASMVKLESGGTRRLRSGHCRGARGRWCGRFDQQRPVPTVSPPRGSLDCPNQCNGVGQCNHVDGQCRCPAGWTGPDCSTPFKRPCTNRKRGITDPISPPANHTDADGRDLNWLDSGWTASRCGGICDLDTAQCWCDHPKYGFLPAAKGSPPGTPPLQRGRPLGGGCQPSEDASGKATDWGHTPYSHLYGEQGWCTAAKPQHHCGCPYDGLSGPLCDEVIEQFCLLQCTGHGTCNSGFCKCHDGWYGEDCSLKRAGAAMEPVVARPWLEGLATPAPAASVPPAVPTRRRPFIFVYDMPPEYTTRMLQYRGGRTACVWRIFDGSNGTHSVDTVYGIETYLHERMLSSEHRTIDPEEADYFYVPTYVTCWTWPIYASADVPWWGPPVPPRVMHAANMLLEAKRWLQKTYPWWDRRGGRDHIWLTPHDEGACWMPTEIYTNSIMLTHWGRLDEGHQSHTAYSRDNYSLPVVWPGIQDVDWTTHIRGHVCYDPEKDLVIPSLKWPSHYDSSPLLAHPPLARDMLCYFRGDVGKKREKIYSRGVRQRLHRLAKEQHWRDKYAIFIGDAEDVPGGYSTHLASSVFCLVLPGDGWSGRAEDAVLHGCIPVVIMDQVHAVFESILDWDSFGVRLTEAAVPSLPLILSAYTPQQVARMQRRLKDVWHRFAYVMGDPLQRELTSLHQRNSDKSAGDPHAEAMTFLRQANVPPHQLPVQNDAWHTIIQWLYSRLATTSAATAA